MSFITQMNIYQTQILGLRQTFFDSPHGLVNWNNRSTAYDIALLCCFCMKNALFQEIVQKKYFKVDKRENVFRNYYWENTQKLLWQKGVFGIKTGITTNAGPCLATAL